MGRVMRGLDRDRIVYFSARIEWARRMCGGCVVVGEVGGEFCCSCDGGLCVCVCVCTLGGCWVLIVLLAVDGW